MSDQYTPARPIVQVAHLPSMALEHRRDFPEIPAIYFVVNAQFAIVYIGEAANLRARWKTHHRTAQLDQAGYRIHWKEIADERRRKEGEQWCIKHFHPTLNRTSIPVPAMKRVMSYVNDVAAYRGVDPRALVCEILSDWAYGRKEV